MEAHIENKSSNAPTYTNQRPETDQQQPIIPAKEGGYGPVDPIFKVGIMIQNIYIIVLYRIHGMPLSPEVLLC